MGEQLASFEVTCTTGNVERYQDVIYFHSPIGCQIQLTSGQSVFFPWCNVRKTVMVTVLEAQAA